MQVEKLNITGKTVILRIDFYGKYRNIYLKFIRKELLIKTYGITFIKLLQNVIGKGFYGFMQEIEWERIFKEMKKHTKLLSI